MKTLVLALLLVASCFARAEEKVLNIYCWDEYLPKDVLDDFTKRTGTKVTLTLYDSNEAMLAINHALGLKLISTRTEWQAHVSELRRALRRS